MAIGLYDISVASSLQIVGAVSKFMEKGAGYCGENNISLDDVVAMKLADDMLPFHFQIISVVHHSLGSIKGVKAGEFGPPSGYAEYDYPGLQGLVTETIDELKGLSADEVNGFEGKDVVFKLGKNEIPFVAENFVLSFSQPNLYFHAATAYDMLRIKGAPFGKRDFLGNMRMKS